MQKRVFFYVDEAQQKMRVLKNDSLQARVLCCYGYYYYVTHDFKESKIKLYEAISLSEKIKFHRLLCYSYNLLGMISSDKGVYEKALHFYLKALDVANSNNIATTKCRVTNNLGNLYMIQKDTAKAIKCYIENIKTTQENNLDVELSKAYTSLAIAIRNKNWRKAAVYYNAALQLAKKNNDWNTEYCLHQCLVDLYINSSDYKSLDTAYFHLLEASKIQRKLKNETLLFNLYFNYGAYYLQKKEYETALNYYHQSLEVSKKNTEPDQRLNLLKTISVVYKERQDYKNALIFKEKYTNLKDSIFDIERNKAFNEIQTKYDVDNKNLNIKLLTKNNDLQQNNKRTILIISISFVGFLITMLFLLWYKIKLQKVISLKENEINKQEIFRLEQDQELKRMNSIMEGQDLERSRLAKEIHDGIGGSLAGIKLQLSQENAELKNEKITVIINKMSAAFNELRLISHNLSFNFLKDKNLENLIYQLQIDYKNRNEFEIEVVVYPENALNNLSEFIKHNLYRIIQELITNVSKHAGANQIELNFTKHDNSLNIIFEDDGVGVETKDIKKGIGLKNIKERILSLNGTIVIESAKGRGTTVIIDIPTND